MNHFSLQTSHVRKKATRAVMVGTMLEYYDMSLYTFMGPLLASIFLPTFDKLSALILIYGLPCVTIIMRPLGALLIGKIGDRHGRKPGLIISISGMAIVTCAIGLLPTYEQIGFAAPILFMSLRALQSFFVAGEYNGGAIFVLEHNPPHRRGYFSGLYCMYTAMGVLAASFVCTIVAELPKEYWRLPYLFGFVTGLVGLYFRYGIQESPTFLQYQHMQAIPLVKTAKKYKTFFIAISVASLFSTLCSIPITLMISLLPQVTSFSLATIMKINVASTLLYMIAYPFFGRLSDKWSFNRHMAAAAAMVFVMSYPLVSLIWYDRLDYIIVMKMCFALLTSWFVAPFHAWMQALFHPRERYTAISLAYSIGSQIGGAMVPLSLWGWKYAHSLAPVYGIIMFWAAVALIALRSERSIEKHD